MDRIKKVSFVIPCYRSEHTLPHVVTEIREKMQELTQYTYDIFLVNDASPDNTMETIRDLCEKYDNIKGIGFARNFGQHAALMAGLRHSDGDYVVCLDDDGQTPADEVDKLLNKLEEGFDAVYASYEHKQHSAFRNLGSKVNELMTRMMLNKPANLYISSYFAVKRFVVSSDWCSVPRKTLPTCRCVTESGKRAIPVIRSRSCWDCGSTDLRHFP